MTNYSTFDHTNILRTFYAKGIYLYNTIRVILKNTVNFYFILTLCFKTKSIVGTHLL